MAFTFTEDLSLDRDFVRFHSNDTIENESLLSDRLIASLITSAGSKEAAVIQAIEYKIGRFSDPNFEADWLKVDNASAVKSLETLRTLKKQALGISGVTQGVTHVYRADSEQITEPDYSEGV